MPLIWVSTTNWILCLIMEKWIFVMMGNYTAVYKKQFDMRILSPQESNDLRLWVDTFPVLGVSSVKSFHISNHYLGEEHRWVLSPISKTTVNHHWCQQKQKEKHAKLKKKYLLSGSHSHIVRHVHSLTLSLSNTHTQTHTICTPSFPKTAKVSKGILFGWNHGWGDGVC